MYFPPLFSTGSLSRYESREGHVRTLPVTWDYIKSWFLPGTRDSSTFYNRLVTNY